MGVRAKTGRGQRRRDKGVGWGQRARRDKKQNWESNYLEWHFWIILSTFWMQNICIMSFHLNFFHFSLKCLHYFPLLTESILNLHQGTQGHSNLNPVFLLWSYHTLNYFHSWSHPLLSYTSHCSSSLKFHPLAPLIQLARSKTNIASLGKFSLKYTLPFALMKGNVHVSLKWAP